MKKSKFLTICFFIFPLIKGLEKKKEGGVNWRGGDKWRKYGSITYPSQERQLLVSQLEEFQGEKSALNATLDQLRAEIKDSADNYKIKERKNIQLAKDLKKQLVNEQKRCAKLQDRLQQVL